MPPRYLKRHTLLPVEHSTLPFGMQNFSVNLDRLGIDEDESDYTRRAAAIDPVMDRAALHEHVAGVQVDDRVSRPPYRSRPT